MEKIAISVLTKGYGNVVEYKDLITRNNLIHDNILEKSKLQYDVIIFHEGNIPKEHQDYISNNSKCALIFRDVKESADGSAFDDTKNKINPTLCPPTELSERFPLGYKHMCHFWSIDFFKYLSDYRYTIRIDEDCYVDRINTETIEQVVEEDIKFAVPLICNCLDDANVVVGLSTLLSTFLEKNGLKPRVPYDDIRSPMSNFMMLNLDYFRDNTLIQEFLTEVDNSHGIYSNRWGDAPIWGVILFALLEEAFYELSDIGYLHGSHNHYVNPIQYTYEL